MQKEIFNELLEKPFVIVAGAGISMLAPASIPGWWDFNNILKEIILKKAFKQLPEIKNQLESTLKSTKIPVTAFSDIIVNSIAGSSYFKLLELLEGNAPNANHYSLGSLVKDKKILSIITTNFDTLIEQAFRKEEIHISVYSTEDDFSSLENSYPNILKIHGSVTNKETFIDTVTQKYKGLNKHKKFHLQSITSKYPLVFIGFSGNDYIFEKDYIPIKGNQNNPIYWVVRKGSSLNEDLLAILKASGREYKIIEEDLPDFFVKLGIEIKKDITNGKKDIDYSVIEKEVDSFFDQPHISGWGCIAIIYDILYKLAKINELNQLTDIIQEVLLEKNCEIDIVQTVLLTKLAINKMMKQEYNSALILNNLNIKIWEEISQRQTSYEEIKENKNNQSTIYNNIGLCYIELGQYREAFNCFSKSIELCEETKNMKNIVISKFNIARFTYLYCTKDYDKLINELKVINDQAKEAGNIQTAFDSTLLLCETYLNIFEFNNAEKLILQLENLEKISSSIQNKYYTNVIKSKIFALLNKPEECENILNILINEFENNKIFKDKISYHFINCLSFYKNHKETVINIAKNIMHNEQIKEFSKIIGNASHPFFSLLEDVLENGLEKKIRRSLAENRFKQNNSMIEKNFIALLKLYIKSNIKINRLLDISEEFESETNRSEDSNAFILYAKAEYYIDNKNLNKALDLCKKGLNIKNISNEYENILLSTKIKINLLLNADIKDTTLDNVKLDAMLKAHQWGELAQNEIKRTNLLKAEEYLKNAIKLYKESNNLDGESKCYNDFAVLYSKKNDFPKAIEYTLLALKIKQKLNNIDGKILTLSNLSSFYYKNVDYINSIDSAKKVLELSLGQKLTREIIIAKYYLSLSLFLNKNTIDFIEMIKILNNELANFFDNSLNEIRIHVTILYKESILLTKSIGSNNIVYDEFNQLISEATRLQKIGDYTECKKILDKLLKDDNISKFKKAQVDATYGYLFLSNKKIKKAKNKFATSLKVFKSYKNINLQIESMRNIARIERDSGDINNAIIIFKDIIALREDDIQSKYDLAQAKYIKYIKNIEHETDNEIISMLESIPDTNNIINGNVYFLLGQIYHNNDNIERRDAYILRATKIYTFYNSRELNTLKRYKESLV